MLLLTTTAPSVSSCRAATAICNTTAATEVTCPAGGLSNVDDWNAWMFDPFAPLTKLCHWIGSLSVSWMPEGVIKDFVGYWVYDLVKIVMLLPITSTALNLLRRWTGVTWLRRSLGRDDWIGMLCGTLLGVVTPVCSCSVTPLYASLVHGGAANRPAACFLFAAPAVNELAIVMVCFALGWQGGWSISVLV